MCSIALLDIRPVLVPVSWDATLVKAYLTSLTINGLANTRSSIDDASPQRSDLPSRICEQDEFSAVPICSQHEYQLFSQEVGQPVVREVRQLNLQPFVDNLMSATSG